ncbi:MAG: AMP-binding protein [Sandaracinaceae bacterium]
MSAPTIDVRREPARPPTAPVMMDPSRYGSLGELLEDALIQYKSETALIEVDRNKEQKRLRYLDVKREAARITHWLAERGVGPNDRVAILMSNQARWLLSAYAVFHRGAVLVPLDYKLTAKEQEALLAHAKPKVLITEHALMRRLGDVAGAEVLVSEAKEGTSYARPHARFEDLAAHDDPPPRQPRERGDVATIVYSSGTGGVAKGCLLPHEAYLSQLEALMELFPMRPGHRYFSILPTNHAIDFMVGFVGPFSCGATVIHQRSLRPEFLSSTMQSYEVTHMALVPLILSAFETSIDDRLSDSPRWARRAVSMLSGLNEMLTSRAPNADLSRRLLSPIHDAFGGKLELLFCGGAFVDRARAERFYRLGLPVVIGYGLTEACTVATVNDLRPFRADSVGRAVKGVELRIHDPGPDGVGEVWLRGPTVMLGYLDEPELTKETITEDGWLRTGDLGWLDAAHHLHLVGRSKNLIVTAGGKNVYPEDVESAFESLPVAELAVLASGYVWPRAQRIEDERLILVIREQRGNGVAAPSRERVLRELRELNQRLAEHKRVRGVLFVGEDLPRTASMKIKRRALADQLTSERSPRDLVEL